jgi:hypothetical protein
MNARPGVNRLVRRLFKAKEAERRRLAALPFARKVAILRRMQRQAAKIRAVAVRNGMRRRTPRTSSRAFKSVEGIWKQRAPDGLTYQRRVRRE